ncbi:MAG: bifunctional phosphoribosylaminoimidazolecarboxamide formyltransferase/IMP cyclohydrolase [Patescibacteria group bacterium]|jgi:phosphoribosylaminoimidazolecarboxamide formyltransferase/IMP cyclohydrolase
MIKRALISVSNKTGLVLFCQQLNKLGVEIVSTGGTAAKLAEQGVPVKTVDELTGWPEMMDGRVKTLHPKIHGGILARRDNPKHVASMQEHNIQPIDLVVVNLYPFAATVQKPNVTEIEAIENIDIGGPALIRAAAKNFKFVGIVVDPADYDNIIKELIEQKDLSSATRARLMQKAFAHTAYYDSMISNYFNKAHEFISELTFGYKKIFEPRYGENPHQKAAFYKEPFVKETSITEAKIIQGKELSYNNIMDADATLRMVRDFTNQPTAVVVKHSNPCGIAQANDINTAFKRAYEADSLSAFGGIVGLNEICTKEIAEYLNKVFVEVVLAPDYEPGALELFAKKPKVRLLKLGTLTPVQHLWEVRQIAGGLLVQETNKHQLVRSDMKVVTTTAPSEEQLADLLFAWKVAKHVKSNSVVLVKDLLTVSIGMGQTSRVDAVKQALWKAGEKAKGTILASEAYFPFRDSIDEIAKTGVGAIIQPGGSIKDNIVIEAANEHKIPMVFTGVRAFLH